MRHLRESVPSLSVQTESNAFQPSVFLHSTLPSDNAVCRLSSLLYERKQVCLSELAQLLWKRSDDLALNATRRILQLSASARLAPEDYPLVPHRLHVQARGSGRLSVCLNADCSGPHPLPGFGSLNPRGNAVCPSCTHACLWLCVVSYFSALKRRYESCLRARVERNQLKEAALKVLTYAIHR